MEEKKIERSERASGGSKPWWREWWVVLLLVLICMLILLLCLRKAGCCEQSKVPSGPVGSVAPVVEEVPEATPAPDTTEQVAEGAFDLFRLKPVSWSVGEMGYVENAEAFNAGFEKAVAAAREANAAEVGLPVAAVRYDIRDYDVSKLESEMVSAVAKAFLQTSQEGVLLVEGHTCNVGIEAYNETLSRRRAERVGELLRSAGVATERVEVKWYGESKYGQLPGVTEQSAHRRVTITVK